MDGNVAIGQRGDAGKGVTTIDVSLLLCTRDRGASLDRTLASITRAAAAAPDVTIEVVVVDNGSTDDTASRVRAWRVRQPFAVHALHQAKPGLARARNTGLAVVRGHAVAMTDDDCVLHDGFLAALAARFADTPAPIVIGGRILPGDPADQPVTVKMEDHPMIAPPDAFPGGFVMGANLAFTRDVVARVGLFDERFGAGARFRAAEDTDFLFRAMACGIAVEYDHRFVVDHHHGRRRDDQVAALLAGYSHGDGALYAKHLLTDRRIVRAIGNDLLDTLHRRGTPLLRHKIAGFVAYCRASLRRNRA